MYQKNNHMLYCSWDIVSDRCNFYFGLFFALPPLSPSYLPPPPSPSPLPKLFFALLACVPKIIIRCMVPETWCAMDGWTDGQADGRKKWKRCVPHLMIAYVKRNKKIVVKARFLWLSFTFYEIFLFLKHLISSRFNASTL